MIDAEACATRPTLLSTFDVDLLAVLTAPLGYVGVQQLESTCTAMRQNLAPFWAQELHRTGFQSELHIPNAERTPVARRVVILENRRRETFGSRLVAALSRLGLDEARLSEMAVAETELRLLQFRHGFVLDRRYARSLRDGAGCDALAFLPDTLPGADEPSVDAAAMRVATAKGAAAEHVVTPEAAKAARAYPQRAAHLPLDVWQQTQAAADMRIIASAGRRRSKRLRLRDALAVEGLGADSKPTIEELLEGRDLDLCAFAPVSSTSPTWAHLFSPPPGGSAVIDPWDLYDGARLLVEAAPERMHYPAEARFQWQLSEGAVGRGPKYHRMAAYTHDAPRRATPVERVRCSSLAEHGLCPAGPHGTPARGQSTVPGGTVAAALAPTDARAVAPANTCQSGVGVSDAPDEVAASLWSAEEEANELDIALRFGLRLRAPPNGGGAVNAQAVPAATEIS